MPKKSKPSNEDIEAFQKAMKGIKPLIQKKVRLTPSSLMAKSTRTRSFQSDPEHFNFDDQLDIPHVHGEEIITYKHSSVSNKILRKLRKGQYNVDALLDLHGMSAEDAKTAVENFLQQCLYTGWRVVLIIHGKGHHSQMPVLKNKLNRWLRETDMVLAFCSATSSHGSGGATYVLLKRVPTKI